MKILLTGVTGYIAQRLLPVLLENNHEVVCCVRDQKRFNYKNFQNANLKVIEVDFLNQESLKNIPNDIDVAYYLIHSMSTQSGDFGKTCFCVAHGRCAITIAAAKVTLAINERVALAKVLSHAHQRIVSSLVAMGVEAAQHITNHARTFNRLGTRSARKAQTHSRHGIQNAPLDWFLTIAHIGQGTALDHAQCIFKVGALRISGQIQRVIGLAVLKV